MIPALHGNWVDLLILIVLVFFIYQGFVNGFWSILIDFISFFGALLISLRVYPLASSFLQSNFSFSRSLGNAVGFLILSILLEIVISYLLSLLLKKIPQKVIKHPITRILGILLSLGQGLILIAFAITLAISLPISPKVKTDISNSKIGSFILHKTTGVEKAINSVFGGAINESLTYLTIEPKSHESIPLDNVTSHLTIDKGSEDKMFSLVNSERKKVGIGSLTWDTKLQGVAEAYAKKMWEEHYFGHYDKDGHDVGYRLTNTNIPFNLAGENLALAPTVDIAETGLMNSPGHRANILDKDFSKVGIGVIDNEFYGKMFVQVFTN